MSALSEIKEARIHKLEKLKAFGMDPYPASTNRTHTCAEAVKDFSELVDSKPAVTLSGRLMAIRGQGAIMFLPISDGTDTFQAVIKKDTLAPNLFELFLETVDIGDVIEFQGNLFSTERGQPSLLVTSWRMLSKTLLPLPDKWHGIQDADERYRKRYLDLLMNPELREMFSRKADFWRVTRKFLLDEGFIEVETPTLEVTTGGAEAAPFKTHHNDFDIDVYLRISIGELWQKRLMAGGFPKTFEIGRAYRNEGSSPEHLQEFTNMEFYWSYADYRDGMEMVTRLYRTLAKEIYGTTKFTTRGHNFDMNDEWQIVDYRTTVLEKTGIDVLSADEKMMSSKLKELGVAYTGETKERLMDTLWKYCRKQISGPAFLVGHPKLVSPLAKSMVDNPELTQRFQPLLAGSEVGNGFSELNDPVDQRERFELQQELIAAGDEEAMMPEWEFVEMLEHGMPPTCGFGFGERLFAFLEDKPIREVTLFPLMKPRSE